MYKDVKATIVDITAKQVTVIFDRTVRVNQEERRGKRFWQSTFVKQFDPKHEQLNLFDNPPYNG